MSKTDSWIDQATKLKQLIKKVSDQHGGDDPVFLDDYASEVIVKYRNNLKEAIACFESLVEN